MAAHLDRIIDRILVNPNLLAPERRVLTLYFGDLVGFGALAESLEAPKLAELMADYFAAMSHEVQERPVRVALLNAFGTAKAISRASLGDLEKAPGINAATIRLLTRMGIEVVG